MRVYLIIVIFIIILIPLSISFLFTGSWHITVVDTDVNISEGLAIDNDNYAHIVYGYYDYYVNYNSYVKYAKNNGNKWDIRKFDNAP
ncbi:MAG: hypothetical protein ACUVWP_09680 [bacterium]